MYFSELRRLRGSDGSLLVHARFGPHCFGAQSVPCVLGLESLNYRALSAL